jgi:hypothetical protein
VYLEGNGVFVTKVIGERRHVRLFALHTVGEALCGVFVEEGRKPRDQQDGKTNETAQTQAQAQKAEESHQTLQEGKGIDRRDPHYYQKNREKP